MLEKPFGFPEPENPIPLSESGIKEDSPRFLAAKEELRKHLKKNAEENGKNIPELDDATLTFMTHNWIVDQGVDAEREKRNEERRRQA